MTGPACERCGAPFDPFGCLTCQRDELARERRARAYRTPPQGVTLREWQAPVTITRDGTCAKCGRACTSVWVTSSAEQAAGVEAPELVCGGGCAPPRQAVRIASPVRAPAPPRRERRAHRRPKHARTWGFMIAVYAALCAMAYHGCP